jgi:protoporphyrinogen oxidase
MKNTVIIGGVLAGLSAGYHLAEHEPTVFEREKEIGGLCRSFTQDGFTFDCTGHLIHLRNPYTKELVAKILPDAFHAHERLASIYSKSVSTPYPFQANTYGLPPEVVKECVMGFVESMQEHPGGAPANFHDWTLRTFGTGIAKHFMLPYNEKFWKQDLHNITSDWVAGRFRNRRLKKSSTVPSINQQGHGLQPQIHLSKGGGIDCLPRALATSIAKFIEQSVGASTETKSRPARRRTEEDYDSCSLSVSLLFRMLADTPDALRQDAEKLSAISVLNFNIGVDRAGISNQHWIYFPEDQFIFSRVGFPMNFSTSVAPEGTSSIYIEITHPSRSKPNIEEAFDRSITDLQRCGILKPGDRILTRHMLDIEFAYVVFDVHRQTRLQNLLDYLESRDIFAAGRYGRWEYFSMEDSILSGKAAAERVIAKAEATRSLA